MPACQPATCRPSSPEIAIEQAPFLDAERDEEPGRRVYVLGDPFVAGVGIVDVEERLTNLLHRRLAPEFKVYNLGRNGADTREEYRVLLQQRAPPDLLILSYYTNDIQQVCGESGLSVPGFEPYANLPPLVRRIVRRSYLLDLLYWRLPQRDLGNRVIADAALSLLESRGLLEAARAGARARPRI